MKALKLALMVILVAGCAPQVNEPVKLDVQHVMDATVHIRCKGLVEDYFYGDMVESEWQGSGCFIREDGVILTAGHVVDGAVDIVVTLRDGTELEATEWLQADNVDLGYIKVDVVDVPYLRFAAEELQVLDTVYISGHPLGWMNNWSVTKGVVSNVERDCEGFFGDFDMIQADAAAWPGNSGGPVVNENGEIVGVLVGGIGGQECLSYIVPSHIADQWEDVFCELLECHAK